MVTKLAGEYGSAWWADDEPQPRSSILDWPKVGLPNVVVLSQASRLTLNERRALPKLQFVGRRLMHGAALPSGRGCRRFAASPEQRCCDPRDPASPLVPPVRQALLHRLCRLCGVELIWIKRPIPFHQLLVT